MENYLFNYSPPASLEAQSPRRVLFFCLIVRYRSDKNRNPSDMVTMQLTEGMMVLK